MAVCAALSLLCPLLAAAKPNAHIPKAVGKARAVDHLQATKRLSLSLAIEPRNAEAISSFVDSLYDPGSPQYRHFVTPEQYGAMFGATEQDYAALQDWAKSKGFTVKKTFKNRLVLSVEASVSDIEKAFKVSMNVYNHPTEARTFFSPDREPVVDAPVALSGIHGLANYAKPRNHVRAASGVGPKVGTGPGGTYMGKDFRNAYVPGTTFTGKGESVGLFQLDGFYPSDIAAYRQKAGIPNIPLTVVPVDGGVDTISDGQVEVCLDIEMCMSMAPGLTNIFVYEGPPDTAPFMDVMAQMADDNFSRQLSCSWGIDERLDEIEPIFQQMAAQGQSFFDATGDFNAIVPPIPFPSDSPSIMQVGGTTLATTSGAWTSEIVWNWGADPSSPTGFVGSSGGISDVFPLPTYQRGVNMSRPKGSTSFRNFPDVALTADNVFVTAFNGEQGSVGGTSCAAPLWAGFMALVNQKNISSNQPPAGFINPVLYSLGRAGTLDAFHDITVGNNTNDDSNGLWFAVRGYDLCTGWGTPGTNLIDLLYRASFTVADLRMTSTNGPLPAETNRPLTFDYSITNAGPLAVTNAVFTADFSLPVGIGTVSTSQGGFTSNTTNVTVNLGSLASNGVAHVTITVTPATVGFLTNLANLVSEVLDPRATNNVITSIVAINPVDLGIGKTAPATAFVGYPMTYTISVTNFGPLPATGVTVIDTLPDTVTFSNATTTQGDAAFDSGLVIFDVGYLDVNYVATMTVTVMTPTDPDTIVNDVIVYANEPDINLTNNEAMTVTDVLPLPPPIYNLNPIGFPTAVIINWNTLSNGTTQVAYGLTTNYTAVSTFDGTLRTNHSVLLTGLLPDSLYYFQVSSVVSGVVYTATGTVTTTATLIMEEPDGAYFGDWTLSSAISDKFGSFYQYSTTSPDQFLPSATAAFNATLPVPGHYDVSLWYPSSINNSPNVPVFVLSATDSIATTVNETVGGNWVPLGADVNFPDGAGTVQLQNNTGEQNKTINANAVKFSYTLGQDKPTDGSVPPWWSLYYLGTNSVSCSADADGDGYSNFAEYVLGTTPGDPTSTLTFAVQTTNNTETIVFGPYQGGRVYKLQYRADFSSPWVTLPNTASVDANGNGVFTLNPALTGFFRLQASLAP